MFANKEEKIQSKEKRCDGDLVDGVGTSGLFHRVFRFRRRASQ